MTGDFHDEGRRLASLVALVFGSLMHAIVGYFVFLTGLVAPGWVWFTMVALWVVAARLLWRWRTSPIRALFVPILMAAIWWSTLMAGDRWLGWTA